MMSQLSMVEARLPPGFRFHPRDEELICDYLSNKVSLQQPHSSHPFLVEVDLNNCEPWDLPEMACVGGKEWYFYSQRDRKYATGSRTNRATTSGYWKATGKDRRVLRKRTLVGMRKTLVFYLGRAPKGKKTEWVMHEFRLEGSLAPPKSASSPTEDWVLCRVFCKKREIEGGGKQGKNGGGGSRCHHHDRATCSSSLPPLVDPPFAYTALDLHNVNINNGSSIQQVPCFSIFTDNSPTPLPPPPPPPPKLLIPSCEKEAAIMAVLSHFNKMDHHHNELWQGVSDQSFLSHADLPATMWYP